MRIPIVQARSSRSGLPAKNITYSDCRELPDSYMSEYSVLGLVVDNLKSALEVLRKAGVSTSEEAFGAEISIPDREELPCLVKSVCEAGVFCAIGDVIDSIYQG